MKIRNEPKVIVHNIPQIVSVRKYEVDTEALRTLLRKSKKTSRLTNRNISDALDRPMTEVEHWFRTDNCFSIPDSTIWFELKTLLNIETTEFDDPITVFEEREGVFEKAQRCYDIEGLAPTLTSTSADEKIIFDENFVSTYKEAVVINKEKTFKYVSLFSGIGGFDLALNRLGGDCVLAAEWDKYANKAYGLLYGDDHLTTDVTKINEYEVPDHDILVFGMPCQAFSVAGKRLGFEDMRGTLYFEAMRIAKAKKPKVLWMENVKGLVGHDKGRTLEVMAQAMCDIGYTIDFEVLNSKYFGVPQNRERIFMIGIRDDLATTSNWNVRKRTDVVAKGKRRIAQLDGVKTFNFDWPSQKEVTVRLRDILEDNVDDRFYLSEDKTAKLMAQLEDRHLEKLDNYDAIITDDGPSHAYAVKEKITPPVRANGGGRQPGMWIIQEAQSGTRLREESGTLRIGGVDHQHVVEPIMLGHIDLKGHDAIKRVYDPSGVSPTLTTMGGGHREPKIAEEVKGKFLTDSGLNRSLQIRENISPPVRVGGGGNIPGIWHVEEVKPKYRIRKLTPLECFRLQGFPDSFHEKLTAANVSNSQLYKMAGNAVTVNVIEAIGERLVPMLNNEVDRTGNGLTGAEEAV